MGKPTDREDMARTEEILDSLVERSARSVIDYAGNRTSPAADLPGKVSLCLDDLLDAAETRLGMTRNGAMVQVLERGIVAWYRGLSANDRLILDLDGTGLFANDDGGAGVNQLRLKLQNGADDDDLDSNDPNPAMAQQQADAYAYQNATYGYTPMTIHSLADGKNGRGGQGYKAGSHQSSKRQRPQSDPRKKRNRGRKRG
jgi:hypothetical protein